MGSADGGKPLLRRIPEDRSQSEVLSVALVFGMVVLGALVVVGLGATALSDTQDRLAEDRTEKTLTQFDSKAALVALGESESQTVSFPDDNDAYQIEEDRGTLRIEVESRNATKSITWSPVVDIDIGTVEFEEGDTSIAYQGGGVFKREGGNSTLVSPPEFHYRGGTLTLPIVNLTGDGTLDGSGRIESGGVTQKFPIPGHTGKTNPLDEHTVTLIVQSDYYEGWGQYFEGRTDGKVEYDHANNKVELTLVTPIGQQTVEEGIRALGTGGTFEITGTAGNPCAGGPGTVYMDSYNSSGTTDNYCTQKLKGTTGENGNLTFGGTVNLKKGSGQSDIKGSVKSGDDVILSGSGGMGQPAVTGDVFYTTQCTIQGGGGSTCEDETGGDVKQINGPQPHSSIQTVVTETVNSLANESDNSDAGVPIDSNDMLDYNGTDTVELESGSYYLEDIDFNSGDKIELNTSSGSIRLAVEKGITVGSDEELFVEGGNTVEIFVNDSTGSGMLDVNGGNVSVKNGNSTELRVFGGPNSDATIDSGTFTGVLYAPPGQIGSGKLLLDHGHLFGAAVMSSVELSTKSSLHYDEALTNEQIINPGARVLSITYLHVTENEITVE